MVQQRQGDRSERDAAALTALVIAAVSAALALLGLALVWAGSDSGALGDLLVGWSAAGVCVAVFRVRPAIVRRHPPAGAAPAHRSEDRPEDVADSVVRRHAQTLLVAALALRHVG
jgi:hypothetical protein